MTTNRNCVQDDVNGNFKQIPGFILDKILAASKIKNDCSYRRIHQKSNQTFSTTVTNVSPKFSAFLNNVENLEKQKGKQSDQNLTPKNMNLKVDQKIIDKHVIPKNIDLKVDQKIIDQNVKKVNEEIVIQLKKMEGEIQPRTKQFKKFRQNLNLHPIESHPLVCLLEEDFLEEEIFQNQISPNFKEKTVNYKKFPQISTVNLMNLQCTQQIDNMIILKIQYNLLKLVQDLKNVTTVIVDNYQLKLLSKFCGVNSHRSIKIQIKVNQNSTFEDMYNMGKIIQNLHQFKCIQMFEIEINGDWLFVSGWLPPRLIQQKMHMKIVDN